MTKWTKTLATGDEVLDEQHKGLFHCLDELQTATAENRTLLAVYTMTRLKHYVREHFDTEEAVMKKCQYPKLAEHIVEHAKFRAKVADLQSRSIVLDVSGETVEFLTDWLVNHIAKSDLDYVRYLGKRSN